MRRRLAFQLMAAPIVGFLVSGLTCDRHGAEPAPDSHSSVLEQLQEHGEARVVVALSVPAALQAGDLVALQRYIAETQNEVLATLGPAGYRDPQLLQSVPSMTLTLLSETALRMLEAHPKVAKVDLDVGGVGH